MATRLELQGRAKIRADQDGADFPTTTQYNGFLDEAAKETFADLVMAGWPIDYSTSTITTNGITRVYPFGGADTVFSATMVYTLFGNQFTELRRVNPGHVAALRSTGATGGFSRFYEVRTAATGAVVEFFPRVSGTYFVDYIADFPGFSGDSAVWLGPPRSDELIVLKAAAKGVRKESRVSDADRLDVEYEKLLLKVKELASWFDQRNAAEMRDSRPLAEPFSFRDVDYFAGPGGMF
jgi:hypothetical protein